MQVLVDHAPALGRGGGWGIQLMRALMDSVDVVHTAEGTEVRMRRRVEFEVGS